MANNAIVRALNDGRVFATVTAAVVSGAFSRNIVESWFYGPGVLFGVIVGTVLLYLKLTSPGRCLIFLGVSVLSWYAAVRFTILIWQVLKLDQSPWPIGVCAGMLGAILMASGAALLFPWFRRPRLILVAVLLGGATGALLGLDWGEGIPVFVAWQMCFAFCLASAYPPASAQRQS